MLFCYFATFLKIDRFVTALAECILRSTTVHFMFEGSRRCRKWVALALPVMLGPRLRREREASRRVRFQAKQKRSHQPASEREMEPHVVFAATR